MPTRNWRSAAVLISAWLVVGSTSLAAEELPPADQSYLDDFASTLAGFREMSVEEFTAQFGPDKDYLVAQPQTFVRGDTGGDGRADLSDAVCILVHLFSGQSDCAKVSCRDALDVDDSGAINIVDAVGLLQFLFQGGPPPRAPYSEPGADPTADNLLCPVASALSYEPLEADHLGQIFSFFLPSLAQEEIYHRRGFVVYDNVKFDSMLRGFFEIWRRDLPVYISVDAILDAVHLSFDRMLMSLEEGVLFGELDAMLEAMDGDFDILEGYAGEREIETELDHVATWICVARSLLAGERTECARDVGSAVDEILGHITSESQRQVSLFGARRTIDFTQYRVRGHYTRSETLTRYFRAMMWVQRTGFEFSRSPHDARLAFLLTALLESTGAIERWSRVNEAIHLMVGVSDSLNPPGMSELVTTGGFSFGDLYLDTRFEVFRNTAFATGAGRQRINSELIWSNPMEPEGLTRFPALFHVMGQRFIVDSYTFQNVTYDRVPNRAQRLLPSALDAWFVLGNRATVPLLADELEAWNYHPNLAALDWIVSSYEYQGFWDDNLYNVWLSALRTLHQDTTSQEYPDVMRTETWDRRMLHAQLASWAHMRRDFILYAKPSFPPGACFYPEGWVDPYPEFYETLATFGSKAREVFGELASDHGVSDYFENLEHVAGELAAIARAELAEEALTDQQTLFIRGWLSHRQLGCGVGPEQEIDRTEPMTFDGWYPRIIYLDGTTAEWALNDGEGFDPTIADVHTTDPLSGSQVLHVGVGYPRLMLTSIENGCGTRAYVGPVLSYHEFVTSGLDRWTDEQWKEELESGARPPHPEWTRDFIR